MDNSPIEASLDIILITGLCSTTQAALVLNASRRFRYTLDLKKEEERQQKKSLIRAHAQVIRAALLFRLAGERELVITAPTPAHPVGDFGIGLEQLSSVSKEQNTSALEEYGGVKGLSNLLRSNLDKGISGDDADLLKRKNAYGTNTYPRKKGRSFWRFLWEAWQDLTLIILIIAAVVSLVLGIKTEGLSEGWYDGGSIAFAVFLVIVVTAVSDYRQSLQFKNLNAEKQNIQLEVMRGGRTVKLSIFDIVVGDVVPLKIGDQVPADGVLITGHSLAVDESSMTGESKIVHKDHKSPFLMSGCKVADGVGVMLVTGVGINTEWGLLMASISEDNGEETPLQVRLNGVATFIGVVGLSVAVLVLAVLLGRYFSGHSTDDDGNVEFVAGKTKASTAVDGVIKIFTIAVTIVVVAVPEGLPLAVTLTLAYSMRKMMRDKALVRRLSACETMGSATTICSDKTGTLTLNQMTVVEAYVGRNKLNPPDDSSKLNPEVLSLINEGIAQNTTGNVFVPKEGGEAEISGSPTEKAILSWAVKLGMNFSLLRSNTTVLHVFPFNSEKKRGGVAVKLEGSGVHIHWKGAAEILLGACTQYLDSDGHLQSIEGEKVAFKEAIDNMAARSLRCVAIAYRSYELDKVPSNEDDLAQWSLPENDLVLLAIVGIKDPCRPGVKEAVELCSKAGVKVRMVTGDNLQTARAIALECGILTSNEEAVEPVIIEGKKFRALSEKEREQIAKKITVMGRSSPNDKLLLVQALRKGGEVVAVTGDGTNDAPALHEADIGLSMGIQGTEVAKESSDIIILDDNFASVVKVVRWGRSVYANIQKFIQFQLTVNVAALVINVVAAISSGDVPLNAVQLLWVNLIMDTLGALALATEPPTDSLMRRAPVGRREPLITNVMWRNLVVQAVYQVTVLLVLNFAGESFIPKQETKSLDSQTKNTLIFNAFVLCQIFNEFNARKPEGMNVFQGVTKNRLFMGIVGMTFILQIIIIEFLGKFTTTVKLDWKLWIASLVIGIVSWPLAVAGKLIPVPKTPLSRCLAKPLRRWRREETKNMLRRRFIEAMRRAPSAHLRFRFLCTQSPRQSSESDSESPQNSESLSRRIEKLRKGEAVGSAFRTWMGDGFPVHRGHVFHAINRLRKLNMNKRALEVMEWVIRERPYRPRELDYSYLVEFTIKLHGIEHGEKLFPRIPPEFQNELLYNNLVIAMLDKGVIKLSLEYMKKMRELAYPISHLVFNRLIILHSSPSRKKLIPKLLTQMKADKVTPHVSTYNILMKIEANEHDLEALVKVFAQMKKAQVEPNEISYCILAIAHAVARLYTATEAYVQAVEKSITGNNWSTFDVLLILYGYLGSPKELERVWGIMQELPLVRSKSYMLAIEAFGRIRHLNRAEELWLEMETRKGLKSVEQFNSMMSVYCKHGLVDKATRLYRNMKANGCKPNAITYRQLALGCLKSGLTEQGLKTLDLGMGMKISKRVRNSTPWLETTLSIVEIFAEKGDVENAERLFEEFHKAKYCRYTFVYNTLIKAYVKAKIYDPNFLRRMVLGGARPDAETYSLLKVAEQFRT
ncbi:hypothetical protein Ahy_B09g094592 [Arachis hypogaea]|uniref:Calcium-transporting ATPase n=1 Tax=Arachis hypogaea TaxID=3818 RepID=A0A444XBW5_ARAHY|nr:hypothetical protein Ahy_B09g094592 [Arachis hypogaea]